MTLGELTKFFDKNLRWSLSMLNGTANTIANNIIKEKKYNFTWQDLLELHRDNKNKALSKLVAGNSEAGLAYLSVVNCKLTASQVKELIAHNLLDCISYLEVEEISFDEADNSVVVELKEF